MFTSFEESANGPLHARLAAVLGTPPRPCHRGRTLGLAVEDRVVAADDPPRVIAPVRNEPGAIVLGRDVLRPLIVTRSAPAGASD